VGEVREVKCSQECRIPGRAIRERGARRALDGEILADPAVRRCSLGYKLRKKRVSRDTQRDDVPIIMEITCAGAI